MNYNLTNESSTKLYNDFTLYLKLLESTNAHAIRYLRDFHTQYMLKYKKPWFRSKLTFEQFLSKITFNTKLLVFTNGEHNCNFDHIRPKEYMWNLKNKTLAKLTHSDMEDKYYQKQVKIIQLAVLEMFFLAVIREVQDTIRKLDTYATLPYCIDDNIVKLHKTVLTSISRMQLYGITK